ncbi:hypothetical protein R1flu_028414 [Riccia fluitans]|uniref:BAG domain-containing protein n=1 Tax=Riccia fluitans TaxID=41844 RepID=A0ABD1XPF8_9MARC
METQFLVQQSAAMAVRIASPIVSQWENCYSGKRFLCDLSVGGSVQRRVKQPAPGGRCGMKIQSFQWCKTSVEKTSRRRMRRMMTSVMNSARPTADGGPSTDELKGELEALQLEASQARDRYESSRARFMRLAQVAEQLQQRAIIELKLGCEGNARQLLTEKKKVLSAADISKRRSQLYELLSIKLSEAISQKESQLMVALSSTPAKVTTYEEPTVRVIFPREKNSLSSEEVLEQELENCLSSGVDGQPPSSVSQKDSAGGTSGSVAEALESAQRDGHPDLKTVLGPEELLAATSLMGNETAESKQPELKVQDIGKTDLGDNYQVKPVNQDRYVEEEAESYSWQEMENAAKDMERDVVCLQEESERLASQLESVSFSDDEDDDVESSSRNEMEDVPSTDNARMGIRVPGEVEVETDVGMNKENEELLRDKDEEKPKVDAKLVFEEYLLDIDSHVAGLESKLQNFLVTADVLLGSNSVKNDERVVRVKDLLQQVQSLRTRILDGVNVSIGQPSQ